MELSIFWNKISSKSRNKRTGSIEGNGMRNGTLWSGIVDDVDYDVDWWDDHYEVFRRDIRFHTGSTFVGQVDDFKLSPEEMHDLTYRAIVAMAMEQELDEF